MICLYELSVWLSEYLFDIWIELKSPLSQLINCYRHFSVKLFFILKISIIDVLDVQSFIFELEMLQYFEEVQLLDDFNFLSVINALAHHGLNTIKSSIFELLVNWRLWRLQKIHAYLDEPFKVLNFVPIYKLSKRKTLMKPMISRKYLKTLSKRQSPQF